MAAREFILRMFVDLNPDNEKIIYSHFTCATGRLPVVNASIYLFLLFNIMYIVQSELHVAYILQQKVRTFYNNCHYMQKNQSICIMLIARQNLIKLNCSNAVVVY